MTATAKPAETLFAVDRVVSPASVFVTCKGVPYHVYATARGSEVEWSPLLSGNGGGTVTCVGGRPLACTCKGFKYGRKCKHLTGTRTLIQCGDMAAPADDARPDGWLVSVK